MSIEKSSSRHREGKRPNGLFSAEYPPEFFKELDRCIDLADAFDSVLKIGLSFQKDKHKLAKDIRRYLIDHGCPERTANRWIAPLNEEWRETKKQTKRQELEEEAEETKSPKNCKLIHGDFRQVEIPDNSIDLIFTDPPYDQESIPLYGDLAEFAVRVLKPGGSLVTYFGQYRLLDFGNEVEKAGLKYWWILCVKHAGASASFFTRKVFVDWKPLLWFVKGDKPNNLEYMHDLIESEAPDKIAHDWQQSPVEAEHLIRALTVEGMKVLDPMMGSGTTGIGALNLDRQFIGIEIDEKKFNIAKSNIAKSIR